MNNSLLAPAGASASAAAAASGLRVAGAARVASLVVRVFERFGAVQATSATRLYVGSVRFWRVYRRSGRRYNVKMFLFNFDFQIHVQWYVLKSSGPKG